MAENLPLFGAPPPNPLFARYQGSNVQAFPAGYLEAFQAAAQMRQHAAEFAATQDFNERTKKMEYDAKMSDLEIKRKEAENDAVKQSAERLKAKTAALKEISTQQREDSKSLIDALGSASTSTSSRLADLYVRLGEETPEKPIDPKEKITINREIASLKERSKGLGDALYGIVSSRMSKSGINPEDGSASVTPDVSRYTSPSFAPLPSLKPVVDDRQKRPSQPASPAVAPSKPATPAPNTTTFAGVTVPAAVISSGKNLGDNSAATKDAL